MPDLNDKLLPCPFCGSADVDTYEDTSSDNRSQWTHDAECKGCGAASVSEHEKDAAIIAWNRRTPAPQAATSGWQTVPKKITEDMHVAAVRAVVRATGNDDFPPSVWAAMLAAAPLTQEVMADEFCEGQWWLQELDTMAARIDATPDQKRAVYGVARNLLRQLNKLRATTLLNATTAPKQPE